MRIDINKLILTKNNLTLILNQNLKIQNGFT